MRYSIFVIVMFLVLIKSIHGQDSIETKIYWGKKIVQSELMCVVTSDAVYEGKVSKYTYKIFSIRGSNIYRGTSTKIENLNYKIKGNTIRYNNNKIIYTIKDEKVFIGKNLDISNCLFTYDGIHVYRGNSKNQQDIWYTVDKPISIYTLAWLLGEFQK